MAYPYTTTVHGLNTLLEHLRSVFPRSLTPQTLRSWNIGRSNESSLLATLRFIGVIDDERNTLPAAEEVFRAETEEEFEEGFAELVKNAYAGLFEKHGEDAWTLSRDELISFMREEDKTSARVGDQQAVTFQALARRAGKSTLGGRGRYIPRRQVGGRKRSGGGERAGGGAHALPRGGDPGDNSARADVKLATDCGPGVGGFAVLINLPATDDPVVYDLIFRSIREHLID